MKIIGKEKVMGQLLFESRGIAKKAKLIFTVCSAVLAVIGFFLIIVANEKRRSYMGYGETYVLGDNGRRNLQLLGIIVVVFGVLAFFNTLAMNKSYLKIYENGIVGVSVIGLFLFNMKKECDLKYSEIEKVQLNHNQMYGDTITVWSHWERYGLMVERDAERAVEMIQRGMNGEADGGK